jgi:hypothetical protein
MDGMVKHPSTRKEQAYVIALGGAPVCCFGGTVDATNQPQQIACAAVTGQCCALGLLLPSPLVACCADHCPSTYLTSLLCVAAGKDYRDSVLKDAKTSLTVIAGGDPDLRQAVTDGEVKQVRRGGKRLLAPWHFHKHGCRRANLDVGTAELSYDSIMDT